MCSCRLEVQLKTTMPAPYLAPEVIENIINNLSDEPGTLSKCSMVSKSWIPHARKHLFAKVRFTGNSDVWSWTLLYLNPLASPSRYTKTLHLTSQDNPPKGMTDPFAIIQVLTGVNTDIMSLIKASTMTDAETAVLIYAFSKVLSLDVGATYHNPEFIISLVPLHGFSSALMSLTITTLCIHLEKLLNLALSFPRLESLSLWLTRYFEGYIPVQRPNTHPPLTGTLTLSLLIYEIIKPVTDSFLELESNSGLRRFPYVTKWKNKRWKPPKPFLSSI
jgi:hypothetical protein